MNMATATLLCASAALTIACDKGSGGEATPQDPAMGAKNLPAMTAMTSPSPAMAPSPAASALAAPAVGVTNAQPDATTYAVWTADGKLQLPTGYRDWTFVGSPVTPNALNDGHAGFPEFHNVYIPTSQLRAYERTGSWADGSIWVKELQLTLPGQNPDGSRIEPSGRGYFPGAFNGMVVMVKDSKRCADHGNWCFFNFGHHAQPYETASSPAPLTKCGGCHLSNAGGDKGMHFYAFYAVIQRPAGAKE